jgi:hypothetical protein
MAVVIERALRIKAPASLHRQQKKRPPYPSLPDRPHWLIPV